MPSFWPPLDFGPKPVMTRPRTGQRKLGAAVLCAGRAGRRFGQRIGRGREHARVRRRLDLLHLCLLLHARGWFGTRGGELLRLRRGLRLRLHLRLDFGLRRTVVLQILLNVLDFDMTIAEATAAPRIHHQWLPDKSMRRKASPSIRCGCWRGREFLLPKDDKGRIQRRLLGRANSILRKDGYLFGAADPRAADGAIVGY